MTAPARIRSILLVAATSLLVACQSLMGPPISGPSAPPPPTRPGAPEPAPDTAAPESQAPSPTQPAPSPAPTTPAPKQFRLGSAASALVKQARAQTGKGDFGAATVTVERALRIEPDNPLVWIELGQIHLAQGNAAQAESMGRKAVALATGDPSAHSASWRLVGDALRARGRTLDAAEAYQRANAPQTR